MQCDKTEYDVLQLLQAGLSYFMLFAVADVRMHYSGAANNARYTTRMTCCAHFPVSVCSGGAYRPIHCTRWRRALALLV